MQEENKNQNSEGMFKAAMAERKRNAKSRRIAKVKKALDVVKQAVVSGAKGVVDKVTGTTKAAGEGINSGLKKANYSALDWSKNKLERWTGEISDSERELSYALLKEHVANFFQAKIDWLRDTKANLIKMWEDNAIFTFWFIPANGQNATKRHVKRHHLKYAVLGILGTVVVMVSGFSVMAMVTTHVASKNISQKHQLEEYKQMTEAQKQTIKQLQEQAAENQKQLAALSKLEDAIRAELEKHGADLPAKTKVEGGLGGPMMMEVSPVAILDAQQKNISLEAKAKAKDFEKLLVMAKDEGHRREFTPSHWPVNSWVITSPFGGRRNPFGGGRENHPGIDIDGNYGDPIYAAASGYVLQSEWYYGYGNYIKIEHDYGYQTAYGHMSQLIAKPGQFVKKGDLIGRVGSTGYSTGPHLHFEVLRNGKQVNPSKLM